MNPRPRRELRLALTFAAGVVLGGCYGAESDEQTGSVERMQNASLVIVSAIAAQEVLGTAQYEVKVARRFQFDSTIKGAVTPATIEARMIIPGQDNIFTAERIDGRWAGKQRKLAFNWDIKQTGDTRFEIRRLGFDGVLDVVVDPESGAIDGRLHRKLAMDFTYSGKIMADGDYRLVLHRPLGWDWEASGFVRSDSPIPPEAPGR